MDSVGYLQIFLRLRMYPPFMVVNILQSCAHLMVWLLI